MKKILFLLFIAISIISCNKNEEGGIIDNTYINDDKTHIDEDKTTFKEYNGNFMEGFFTPTVMNLQETKINSSRAIFIKFYTDIDKFYPEILYQVDMSEQKKSIFKEYIKFYGDTLYPLIHNHAPGYYGCKFPIDNISIVADKDFDSNHPKGSELNDLFKILPEYRYIGYIENNYNDNKYELFAGGDYLLNEIFDFKLLSEKSCLIFQKYPSDSGLYTFTVTINFLPDPVSGEECESLVQTVIMKF